MALYYPDAPNYVVVDETSERNTQWHEGTICYVKSNNTLYVLEGGSWVTLTSSGGSGTVTDVSVTTANGVSGSVANSTSTPAISLTLGAITPTTIVASGAISGSNLSGTNTGDQTISLTGDVSGSGTGSISTTVSIAKHLMLMGG